MGNSLYSRRAKFFLRISLLNHLSITSLFRDGLIVISFKSKLISEVSKRLPQDLSQSDSITIKDREAYHDRLRRILDGFLLLPPEETTSHWRHILRQASVSEWVAAIESCTLEIFKDLLSAQHPPTANQLKSLPYIKTNRPDVYLSMIERKDGTGHSFIYVGSASSPYGGLHSRVGQHTSPVYSAKAAYVIKTNHR